MNTSRTGEQVDSILAKYHKQGSPGCAMAVIRDGEIVYQRGYGPASVEDGAPITPATVVGLGSMSKQFTGRCESMRSRWPRYSLTVSGLIEYRRGH